MRYHRNSGACDKTFENAKFSGMFVYFSVLLSKAEQQSSVKNGDRLTGRTQNFSSTKEIPTKFRGRHRSLPIRQVLSYANC